MEEKNREILLKIEDEIQSIIKQFTGILIEDKEVNLLDNSLGVMVVDYLYVIQEIEKRYRVDLSKIIAEETFEFFTIKGIARKIVEEA